MHTRNPPRVDHRAGNNNNSGEFDSIEECAVVAHNNFINTWRKKTTKFVLANRKYIQQHLAEAKRKSWAATFPPELHVRQFHHQLPVPTYGLSIVYPQNFDSDTMPRIVTKTYNRKEKLEARSTPLIALPKFEPNEPLCVWQAVKSNLWTADEPHLQFIPYFGDEDEDDVVSNVYKINFNRNASKSELEFEQNLLGFILKQVYAKHEREIKKLGKDDDRQDPNTNCSALAKLLANALNLSPEVVETHIQEHATQAQKQQYLQPQQPCGSSSSSHTPSRKCRTSSRMSPPHSNHRIPLAVQSPPTLETSGSLNLNPVHPEGMVSPAVSANVSLEDQMYAEHSDSYRALFCRICYVYDCNRHALIKPVPLSVQLQKSLYYRDLAFVEKQQQAASSTPSSSHEDESEEYTTTPPRSTSVSTQAREETMSLLNVRLPKWVGSEMNSIAQAILRKAFSISCGQSDHVQAILCRTFAPGHVLKEEDLVALCQSYGCDKMKLIEEIQCRGQYEISRKSIKRKQYRYPHVLQKGAHKNIEMSTSFQPCSHMGPCSLENCTCIQANQCCTKQCFCIPDLCRNFFRGCRCKSSCSTKACPCYAAGRECDLDYCVPIGKHDANCCNRNISKGKKKHLAIAKSQIKGAGFGAYTTEYIQKDEFIQEYVGELISQEEAERRGSVYDKKNRSYLFNLNTESVIDAARKGKKARFFNHSTKPNCYIRMMFVKGTQHIGIYAAQNIEAHSELFYNYFYDKEVVHENMHKRRIIVDWMKDANMAGKISKQKGKKVHQPLPYLLK